MVAVIPAPPALTGELTLFHTTDPFLKNAQVLVFYGPAASIGAATSRVQIHVLTPAGFAYYPRLAVSPSSPEYGAVSQLPYEEQSDEIRRGLAFGLAKYFRELPQAVKERFKLHMHGSKKAATPFEAMLFGNAHVSALVSKMTLVENKQEVTEDIQRALGEESVSWLDLDVVLPPGSVHQVKSGRDSIAPDEITEDQILAQRYMEYAPLIKLLGEPGFIPTSKLKRAPSRPTAIGRSRTFSSDQKETVRKEMCELVDTEDSYVSKLSQLVHDVAQQLRDRTAPANEAIPVASPAQRAVEELFPSCLNEIFEANSGFLDAIKAVMDETEEAAIADIQGETDVATPPQTGSLVDPTGARQFAKCLLEWLPKFAGSYPEYMQAHSKSSLLLKQLSKSADPTVADAIREIGEKRLMSLLIEPVQRLPRYTLYIDTIAKQLPVAHPAIKSLLKARDLVSEICSQDASGAEQANMQDRLNLLVRSWPQELQSLGRLVSVVDMVELDPPYEPTECRGPSGLLLLFSNCLISVEKTNSQALSARAFIAELDKPAARDSRPRTPSSLKFAEVFALDDMNVAEFLDNSALSVLPKMDPQSPEHVRPSSDRVYLLEGVYAGKASRFLEEMTKARVEGRFTETVRESPTWEVRSAPPATGELGLFNAVYESPSVPFETAGNGSAPIRIVFDPAKHETLVKAGEDGVEAVISVFNLGNGFWQVAMDSILMSGTRDRVTETEFLPVLTRRLTHLLHARFSIRYPPLTGCFVVRNQQILECSRLHSGPASAVGNSTAPQRGEYTHRPRSPVKMISNLVSSSILSHQPSGAKKLHNSTAVITDAPVLPPPATSASRPTSKDQSRPTSKDQPGSNPATRLEPIAVSAAPTNRLEDTLSSYLLALLHRKGNVVGKVIRGRINADELAVNDLYNSLLEEPQNMVYPAQASVDVLFAAFEKFLNVVWQDHFGPVMPLPILEAIQSKAETLFPVEFEKYFKDTFHNMVPQNQRALKGVIKLLAELLDGTGNDGDRGILTAAFVEVLAPEADVMSFVSLIDRFVEDMESLFGETVEVQEVKPTTGSGNGHTRSRSVNTGSLTSNTSSLRKKFGFGTLARENSKSENDSKSGFFARTLSKSTRGDPPSISKGSLQRTKSTDMDSRMTPQRPNSQDRPKVLGAYPFERPASQDASSFIQNSPLGTIGEHTTPQSSGIPKKKRRSSLSDLKTLDLNITGSPLFTPSPARKMEPPAATSGNAWWNGGTTAPTPTKTASVHGTNARFGSPVRDSPRSRLPSSFRKENSPSSPQAPSQIPTGRPRSLSKQPSDEVTITTHASLRHSNIPTLAPRSERAPSSTPVPVRTGLSERPNTGNTMKIKPASSLSTKSKENESASMPPPSAVSTPTRKLRMQSPQKLRERLQTEQKAITSTQNTLQDELSRIGDEITALGPGRVGSVRGKSGLASSPYTIRSSPAPSITSANAHPSAAELSSRLAALESTLSSLIAPLNNRTDSIQADLSSSLAVSEAKARKLDELYRDANAENEALYQKFNDELSRVLKVVKSGEGVEELRRKIREGQEEAARLRRDNARLKREVVGLRAQLKE